MAIAEAEDTSFEAQDSRRESDMRRRFGLIKDPQSGRSGIDAHCDVPCEDGPAIRVPFELKSTTADSWSVSTVRDLGQAHLDKWDQMHWLIGFYTRKKDMKAGSKQPELEIVYYGPPRMMRVWYAKIHEKLSPDRVLARELPCEIREPHLAQHLDEMFGFSSYYSPENAQSLLKSQWDTTPRRRLCSSSILRVGAATLLKVVPRRKKKEPKKPKKVDIAFQPIYYTRESMLQLLRARVCYLLHRGATVNNPHIEEAWITANLRPVSIAPDPSDTTPEQHAERLKDRLLTLVIEELAHPDNAPLAEVGTPEACRCCPIAAWYMPPDPAQEREAARTRAAAKRQEREAKRQTREAKRQAREA